MSTAQVDITGVLFTDQRDFYPDPSRVARLHPNARPFITDIFAMTPGQTPDVDFKMFQKDAQFRDRYVLANGADTWGSGGTPSDTITIAVDGATNVTVDSSLLHQVCEIWNAAETSRLGVALVTTVSGSDVTLTAIGNPDSATEAIANTPDNAVLRFESHASGEIETAPDADDSDPDVVWNSLQHVRTSLQLSNDLNNSALQGVDGAMSKLSEMQTDKLDLHLLKVQRALMTGYRVGGTGGVAWGADSTGATTDTFDATHTADATNGRIRTNMGLVSAIVRYGKRDDSDTDQSYFARAKGSYSLTQFGRDMDKLFQWDDDPRMLGRKRMYCGPEAYFYFSGEFTALNAEINFEASQTGSSGYRFGLLTTPVGDIELVRVNDWRSRGYTNYALIPTMRFLKPMVLSGSGPGQEDPGLLGYFRNIKTDDRPLFRKDEYHSHVGLDIRHIKSQGLIIVT